MQRYESFIAVYEYFAKNYFFLATNLEASILYLTINFGGHLVIWSFVKIENTLSKSCTIIINIYIYIIVIESPCSEIDFDQMTMTKMTR